VRFIWACKTFSCCGRTKIVALLGGCMIQFIWLKWYYILFSWKWALNLMLQNSRNVNNHYTGLNRPWDFQEVEAPYAPVAFTPKENIAGTHFCHRLNRAQDHNAAGSIMLMKNTSDTIGNRTRCIPACSTVPQTTEQPNAPRDSYNFILKFSFNTVCIFMHSAADKFVQNLAVSLYTL